MLSNGNQYLRRGGTFTFVQNGGTFRWAVTDLAYTNGSGSGSTQTLTDVMVLSPSGALTLSSNVGATSFVKVGGLQSQFLKADGTTSTIASSSGSIGITGTTDINLEMQWGAADW